MFAKLPPCSLGFCSRLGSGPICTLWKPHSNVPLNLVCLQKEIVKMRYLRSFSVCTRKCAHLAIHLLPSLRFGCSLLSNLGCLRKMRALHPHICLWLTSHMDVKRSWWFFLCKHWNVERISNSIHSYPCFSIFIHCYPVLSCITQSISSWKPSWLRPRLCFSRSFGLDQMLPAFYQRWVASLLEQAYIVLYHIILYYIISYHIIYCILYIKYIYMLLYVIYYIILLYYIIIFSIYDIFTLYLSSLRRRHGSHQFHGLHRPLGNLVVVQFEQNMIEIDTEYISTSVIGI